ncbi:MAG: hypothetical protein IT381_09560 [Deltaproteobacteria bacterium]|nr:hypothetical protein [Deltaproteobacteria bacterium]
MSTSRSRERGLSFIGILMLAAAAGGAYVGLSYFPVFRDDYAIKQIARGSCNDFLAMNVRDGQQLEELFFRRLEQEKLAHLKVKAALNVEEADHRFAAITVTYTRTWNLLFTKKTYSKPIKWTMRTER